MTTSLKLVPVPLVDTVDIVQELEKPGVSERLARGFRWYAYALDNVVDDGVFLLRNPHVVFLLDLDVVRAFLLPGEQRGDVAGLITAFLRHSSVHYAIPAGCFEELLDWLAPMRHLLLELRSTWSDEVRLTIEARLNQFIGVELADVNPSHRGGGPTMDELLALVQRLEALLNSDRCEGFAEDYDLQLAQAIESQICALRNRRSTDDQPHDKRDRRDAANLAVARYGRLHGQVVPLVLVTRTREVADLAHLLEEEGIGSDELAEQLTASSLEDFKLLEIYPVLGAQRLSGLWSAGYFHNPSGTINEAQLLASLCRGVTDRIMSQSVFKEIAARRGTLEGEEAVSRRERPAIIQTFEDVVRHYVNGKLELSRIAQIERLTLGLAAGDSSRERAGQILKVLSRLAQKLLGSGRFEYHLSGNPGECCTVAINRVFRDSRPLGVIGVTVHRASDGGPGVVSVRWPIACNEFRFFEVLNKILSNSSDAFFEPYPLSDAADLPDSCVILHTNLGSFVLSVGVFISEAAGHVGFPGRGRLLRLLNNLRTVSVSLGSVRQKIVEIRQITILTPLGDVRFDVEKIGLNEDRFLSIISEGMQMTNQLAYLAEETSIWWIEAVEASEIFTIAMQKASEFLSKKAEEE